MAHHKHNAEWKARLIEATLRGVANSVKVCPINRAAQSDQDEALRMIEAGDTNARIMEWFGWSREKVVRLRGKAREMAGVG